MAKQSITEKRDALFDKVWLAPDLPQALRFGEAVEALGVGASQAARLLKEWLARRELQQLPSGHYAVGPRFADTVRRIAEQMKNHAEKTKW